MAAREAAPAANPVPWNPLLVGVLALLGLALLWGRSPALAYALAVGGSAFTWWFGQALGALGTGLSTDPNSGAVFILFFLCPSAARWPLPREAPEEPPLWTVAVATSSARTWPHRA